MKIDIGGGLTPAFDHVNLDPVHGSPPWQLRAQDAPWPADNLSVEAVRASHVLEHIPAGPDRIFVFNEAHRVLYPGGTFEIIVPCVPQAHQGGIGWQAFADPTHVSFWVYPESFLYFCVNGFAAHASYGIRLWSQLAIEDARLEGGWEAHVTLRKPL